MDHAEIREQLAPAVAAKILQRCPSMAAEDASLLAHEIIARVQSALAEAPPWEPAKSPRPGCG